MKKSKGFLISFEGGEGGGKSTQIIRLRDRLAKAGHDVIVVREPGGTAIGEQIREVLLSHKNIGMSFTTEVLLFQAARAQIYREVILPNLEMGKIVLMDRTRDSSVVYQGVVRGFGSEMIEQLNNLSTKDTFPNLTLLLDLPVEVGLKRLTRERKADRIEAEGLNFHRQVRDAYLDLVKQDGSRRWQIIDAQKSLVEVEEMIWDVVQKRLNHK